MLCRWRENQQMHGNILRVSAYARVSTDKEDQTNSLASQKNYFAEYITRHKNWKLNKVYYDEGISGTQTKKRMGFQEMIQDAMNGEMDLILTKEVSRFSRNTVDTISYTRQLKDAGVGVLFTIDNIDTRDLDGELRLTIMASIAQEESRKTSERVKWGQKRSMEQGVVFGRDLLGYTVTVSYTHLPNAVALMLQDKTLVKVDELENEAILIEQYSQQELTRHEITDFSTLENM